MRIHSTSSMGLPREIPAGSGPVVICGHTFKAGDVLSVPSYTIHRSKEIWGADAEKFVPERWSPERLTPSATVPAPVSVATSPRWNSSLSALLCSVSSNSRCTRRDLWRLVRDSCASRLVCRLVCVVVGFEGLGLRFYFEA